MGVAAVTVRWTGFTGGPGYTKLHFTGSDANGSVPITDVIAQAAADVTRTWASNVTRVLPSVCKLDVMTVVESFDVVTGQLESEFSVTPGSTANGQVAGAYSAASGAVIHWLTSDIAAGRRVRGRSFVVPMAGNQYDTDGSIVSSALGFLELAAQETIDASDNDPDCTLVVWRGARQGVPGSTHAVTGFRVPDMAAVLRSRRD